MRESANVVWQNSLGSIRSKFTEISFNQWLKAAEPLGFKDDTLVIVAQDEQTRNTLTSVYSRTIEDAVNTANASSYRIRFIAPGERAQYAALERGQEHLLHSVSLNPKYRFDSFVIGNSNNFAYNASLTVAENPATAYNPLFIYGGVGLGKTHLMHAIGHHIVDHHPEMKVLYVTSEALVNDLIESIRKNETDNFRERYRNVDVLIVDDIQFIAGKDRSQEEFFHTFNALHIMQKQIVISSDRPPKEIPTLEDRLRTRFEWGLTVDIQPPDLETRIAILRNKATTEDLAVGTEAIQFIAENFKSNIRELEGSFNRLVAYSKLKKIPITIELAEEVLKDILPNSMHRPVTMDKVQEVVAEYYGITVADINSTRRGRSVSRPRQIAMYICRNSLDISLPKIGDKFGKDHSTVIHGVDSIASDMKEDKDFAKVVEDIIARVYA